MAVAQYLEPVRQRRSKPLARQGLFSFRGELSFVLETYQEYFSLGTFSPLSKKANIMNVERRLWRRWEVNVQYECHDVVPLTPAMVSYYPKLFHYPQLLLPEPAATAY